MLSLRNINKGFGNKDEDNYRLVLNELSFDMEKGESIAVVGPSGSGKTTLLNIIGALDQPDSGQVLFNSHEIYSLNSAEIDHFRNREIGFVFQFHHLLPQLSLMENVLIPTIVLKDKTERKNKIVYAEELLKKTGIYDHKDKLPEKLSGGECQRTAVVRAMINRPSLLLADEPTGALDSKNADIIADLLIGLNRSEGLALLVVTHSMELAKKMDKLFLLENGKLILK
jgi:lipoprotein-releasing system ATP-binding protein